MIPIGFSTGALRDQLNPKQHMEIYKSVGADAIELCLVKQRLFDDEWLKLDLSGFRYKSVHAPSADLSTNKKVVDRLKKVCSALDIDSVVVHPDNISNFEKLQETGLPIALENMDERKKVGKTADFFSDKNGFGFCLDIQHVWCNDKSMKLGGKLAEVFGEGIKQYHVSGYDKELLHSSLYDKKHRFTIMNALQKLPRAPVIIESYFAELNTERLQHEISFIRSTLSA